MYRDLIQPAVCAGIPSDTYHKKLAVKQANHSYLKLFIKNKLLGGLGSFHLIVHSEGSATEAEANANKIKKVNIRFTASEEFRDALKKATFKDAASLSKK